MDIHIHGKPVVVIVAELTNSGAAFYQVVFLAVDASMNVVKCFTTQRPSYRCKISRYYKAIYMKQAEKCENT